MPIFSQLHHHFTQGVPSAEKERMEFVPDAIPYGHNKEEYAQAWTRLSDPKAGAYFYTDGFVVRRAGRLRNAWESVRGAFGFTNRCNPERAQMTLQKLAYYGYLNGYDQTPLSAFQTQTSEYYRLPEDFFKAISGPLERNAKSKRLQDLLVSFYRKHEEKLRPKKASRETSKFADMAPSWQFGTSLLENDKYILDLIGLDPQDDSVIQNLVPRITGKALPESSLQVGSKLREAYIAHILQAYIAGDIPSVNLANSLAQLNHPLNPTNPDTVKAFADRMAKDPGLEGTVPIESRLWFATLDRLLENLLADSLSSSEFKVRFHHLKAPNGPSTLWEHYLNQHLGSVEQPVEQAGAQLNEFAERLAKLNRYFQPPTPKTIEIFATKVDRNGPLWPAFIEKLLNDYLEDRLKPENLALWLEGLQASISVTDQTIIPSFVNKLLRTPGLDRFVTPKSRLWQALHDKLIERHLAGDLSTMLLNQRLAGLGSSLEQWEAALEPTHPIRETYLNQSYEKFLSNQLSLEDFTRRLKHLNALINPTNPKQNEAFLKLAMNTSSLDKWIAKDSELARAYADRVIAGVSGQMQSWVPSIISNMFSSQSKIPPEKVAAVANVDSTADVRHHDFLVKFYLSQNDYANALRLIATMKDLKIAVTVIRQLPVKTSLIEQYVKQDSPLGIVLAGSLIGDIESKPDQLEEIMETAATFASHDTLKKNHPDYYLAWLIKKNQLDDAYAFYEPFKDKSVFFQDDLENMAALFHQRGEHAHRAGKTHRQESKWEEAEKAVHESAHAKKLAYLIVPGQETYKARSDIRGYHVGKTLLRSPLFPEKRADRLDAAINELKAACEKKGEHQERIKKTLIDALEERADLAVKACLTKVDMHSGCVCDNEHREKVLSHIQKATECFNAITQFNPHGEYPIQTAKAYFMLADINTYFSEEPKTDSENYHRAMELMPENPFYVLRCSELAALQSEERTTLQNTGLNLLRAHNLTLKDYMHWFDHRWAVYGDIAACHRFNKEPEKPAGWLPQLW